MDNGERTKKLSSSSDAVKWRSRTSHEEFVNKLLISQEQKVNDLWITYGQVFGK